MIQLNDLTKKYDEKTVVDGLNITFQPGVVTGFLGPNGSGKSTTIKMIVSLVHPTRGEVTVSGTRFSFQDNPTRSIGTLIDPSTIDMNLTARQHLTLIALTSDIEKDRIDEMLKLTGLESVQHQKVKFFSLGMKQRLGVATALINDSETIILDEPFNGLDVDGIKWLRKLFKQLAREGKSVIVSSHLMSEIQAVADQIIIIAKGKLLANMSIDEMNQRSLISYVYVEVNDLDKMSRILKLNHADVTIMKNGLKVQNLDLREIGNLAFMNKIVIYELRRVKPTLEQLFTEITDGKTEYVGGITSG